MPLIKGIVIVVTGVVRVSARFVSFSRSVNVPSNKVSVVVALEKHISTGKMSSLSKSCRDLSRQSLDKSWICVKSGC